MQWFTVLKSVLLQLVGLLIVLVLYFALTGVMRCFSAMWRDFSVMRSAGVLFSFHYLSSLWIYCLLSARTLEYQEAEGFGLHWHVIGDVDVHSFPKQRYSCLEGYTVSVVELMG